MLNFRLSFEPIPIKIFFLNISSEKLQPVALILKDLPRMKDCRRQLVIFTEAVLNLLFFSPNNYLPLFCWEERVVGQGQVD